MSRLWWPLSPGILLLSSLFYGIRAYHFNELPPTITAFQPQTMTLIRDDSDRVGRTLYLDTFDSQDNVLGGMTTIFDGTQAERPVIYTPITAGPLYMQAGLAFDQGQMPNQSGPSWTLLKVLKVMVVSPVESVGGTTAPPTSSATSSVTTGPTASKPPSPTIANDFNTSASNSSRAKIIGGAVGGGGFLVVLIVIFLWRRQRSKQARDWRVQGVDQTAAVIDPFPSTTPVSNPLSERKETLLMPASDRKAVEGSDHLVVGPMGGEQSINPRQPETEHGGGESLTRGDDNRPVDQASYRALQAQVRLLMQRMERVEGVDEAPPEYVSAYGSSR
ncbi:hypothetical protein PM082_014742 [Marasmius tenuissimus]|nr:hypothetical protein PM082_014742 [Marasmius tenuissimus]